ncbi:MAG: FAD-dependent oxidoreductase [Fermentimonas sp.]|jgi:hypothetical protein
MNRRDFLTNATVIGGTLAISGCKSTSLQAVSSPGKIKNSVPMELNADVIIAGGGMGGCAAALACCRNGMSVIMTEETDWIGGQLSSQGVPPDEHPWIETHGAPKSYQNFRARVRDYYRNNYPLTDAARSKANLNPGDGAVSRLCHEPRVAVSVLNDMLMPYISTGKLKILLSHKIKSADVTGDKVNALMMINTLNGDELLLSGKYFVDATECGDLLPITGTEYITGTESKSDTGELHAADKADPTNNQAFTVCFAMDYQPGVDNVKEPPRNYNFWKNYVPDLTPAWSGRLLDLSYSNPSDLKPKRLEFDPTGRSFGSVLNLWNYRRVINKNNFVPGTYESDISIVNWPQNDLIPGNLIDVSENEFNDSVTKGKELSAALFYWLQTEVPRADGKQGWPGLRLRGDIMGTNDGMAKYPYIRESRRIKAEFRILEEHVGAKNRALVAGEIEGKKAADFYDSVGVGYYHIDLHPSSNGNNYIDFPSLPFQIPLGALLPVRMNNLLPANKNIGTTHITNGCYRLHPVEWSIGEAVGCLISFADKKRVPPRAVRENRKMLSDFQSEIKKQGIETIWP